MLSALIGKAEIFVRNQELWLCKAINDGEVPSEIYSHHKDVYFFVLHRQGMVNAGASVEYMVYFLLSFLRLFMETCFLGVVATAFAEADPLTREFKHRMVCGVGLDPIRRWAASAPAHIAQSRLTVRTNSTPSSLTSKRRSPLKSG